MKFSVAGTAKAFGISRNTVYVWIKQGLPHVRRRRDISEVIEIEIEPACEWIAKNIANAVQYLERCEEYLQHTAEAAVEQELCTDENLALALQELGVQISFTRGANWHIMPPGLAAQLIKVLTKATRLDEAKAEIQQLLSEVRYVSDE